MDHATYQRALALVNSTREFFNGKDDLNIFALWNSTSSLANIFTEGAESLRQIEVSEFLQELGTLGIAGIGVEGWVSSICDEGKHGGRPTPSSADTMVSQGNQATPMCWLMRRQLYSQSQARFTGSGTKPGVGDNLVDLGSAQRTGIFNRAAPNIWFGVWQRASELGGSQWQVFMGDTWDRTGNSIFGEKGLADDVLAEIEIRVPIALVELLDGPDLFNLSASGVDCGNSVFYSTLNQTFSSTTQFSSPVPSVVTVRNEYTVHNCRGPVTYDLNSIQVVTIPSSFAAFSAWIGDPDPKTDQPPLIVEMPYDTANVIVTYSVAFDFVCGAPLNPAEQYGFAVSTNYTQFNGPGDTTQVRVGAIDPQLCSRAGPASQFVDQIDTFYLTSMRAPDNMPESSVCRPVFTSVPTFDTLVLAPDSNTTAAYLDSINDHILWECATYAVEDDQGVFSTCNVSGSTGFRTGDCNVVQRIQMPTCNQWYNLNCNPYGQGQIMFLLFLFPIVALLLMFTWFLIRVCINRAKRPNQERMLRKSAVHNKEVVSEYIGQQFKSGIAQKKLARIASFSQVK